MIIWPFSSICAAFEPFKYKKTFSLPCSTRWLCPCRPCFSGEGPFRRRLCPVYIRSWWERRQLPLNRRVMTTEPSRPNSAPPMTPKTPKMNYGQFPHLLHKVLSDSSSGWGFVPEDASGRFFLDNGSRQVTFS